MDFLYQTYNALPDHIKGILAFIVGAIFFALMPTVAGLWLALDQILLDFIYPPWGKKFRIMTNSLFHPDDASKGPRS